MKKILLFLVPVVVFMLSSCGGDSIKVIRVPEAENVQLSLEGEISDLLAPRAMSVADGHLIVYEDKVEHPFLIFDLPFDGKYYRTTSRGRGPGEVINPYHGVVPTKDGFQILDSGDGTMKRFVFERDTLSMAEVVDIPFKISPTGMVLPLGEGFIYNSSLYREFSKEWAGFDYHYIDPKTGDITLMCQTPEWKDNVEESSNVILRTSTPAVRPDGSKFAVLYAFHNRIIIFDAGGNVLEELSLPLEGVNDKFDSPVFYRRVVAFNDDWIVAQYGVDEYHFLDWNGKMRKRVVMDRELVYPSFDFDTNTFYGLDLEEEVPKLYSAGIKF
ncbi:MAG: hypothetical protein IJJ96_08175 [Bacteroidales bacterium]|nr:hypothetical protein [Bacteroidales bacterium]